MRSLAFFNNKGGVGKTTLVYHLAHMWADQGQRVLLVDLDPQSNLTAMCLDDELLEELWPELPDHPGTIFGGVRPIIRGIGDVLTPPLQIPRQGLAILPGDLALSSFEDKLSDSWARALDRSTNEAALRALSAFHRIMTSAADEHRADLVLVDVGPNLGAINRAALLSVNHVVTPLAPDLFSMQGLRNLGPTLQDWRQGWQDRLERSPDPELDLPAGDLEPAGYVVMQTGMRLSRPVKAYQKWVDRMPAQYHHALLGDAAPVGGTVADPYCLGVMRHYQSLMPLAQDANKPMFHLRPADGAIGSHVDAVRRCREDFERLADRISERLQRKKPPKPPLRR